ncbi:MAG: hypothetical protein ACXAEN_26260 [Candidatus Thorarchaeota archaeon]
MYQWPDERGRPVVISVINDQQLEDDTQRLVDAHRRFLDDCLLQLMDGEAFDVAEYHKLNTKMVFTGRLKVMVDECRTRGIEINVDRVVER